MVVIVNADMSRWFTRQQRAWNDLAALDPHWAILSHAGRKHRGWDSESFFATGEREVDSMLAVAGELGKPANRTAALDFGCGLGRLTHALSCHFDRVIGVDISESMITQARELSEGKSNCAFMVGEDKGLAMIETDSIDLIYSNLVLQHLPSRGLICEYLGEFLRVAKPQGLVVFQLPAELTLVHRLQLRRRVYATLRLLGFRPGTLYGRLGLHPFHMTCIPRGEVTTIIKNLGGRVASTRGEARGESLPSVTYFVTPATAHAPV
jgi:SAM-dependent methyltransferase